MNDNLANETKELYEKIGMAFADLIAMCKLADEKTRARIVAHEAEYATFRESLATETATQS